MGYTVDMPMNGFIHKGTTHILLIDIECPWFFASLFSQGLVCECKVFKIKCTTIVVHEIEKIEE